MRNFVHRYVYSYVLVAVNVLHVQERILRRKRFKKIFIAIISLSVNLVHIFKVVKNLGRLPPF